MLFLAYTLISAALPPRYGLLSVRMGTRRSQLAKTTQPSGEVP